MEKEPQPESLATVNMKQEYAPSEVYSSEPPPFAFQAYHKGQSSAVQVAKIVAVTVITVSIILGGFILASAYVTANNTCIKLEQELELLNEAADRFQAPLQPEALVQDEPVHVKRQSHEQDKEKSTKELDNNNIEDDSESTQDSGSDSSESDEEEQKQPIHFKLPLQLDFDDLAGALIEKNQKSRMNCVVEKKRAEEVVDHQPKTLRLPFGVNLTTDPRFEHLSGERMVIMCESGNFQRAQPQQENDQEDTIMIQPVMIPIPQTHFQTHMPQQMRPLPPQYPQQSQQAQPSYHRFHPLEAMRPPMPPMMPQPQQPQEQPEFPPNPILHQIAQQIIAHKIMESQRAAAAAQEENNVHTAEEMDQPEHNNQRIPLPEEVLTQLNRLPNRDVIVAVSEQDNESQEPSQEIRVVQEPRQGAGGMNGRQTYTRSMVIPVQMMPRHDVEQAHPQEPQAAATEERHHYLQPRSVRSVDALLPKSQKRVKRCACDCAC